MTRSNRTRRRRGTFVNVFAVPTTVHIPAPFLDRLRHVDEATGDAVDVLLDSVKQARRSKPPREL
jgi:hypothetical protein